MFDGVVMDVIDMGDEVAVVADCVFPEARLPDGGRFRVGVRRGVLVRLALGFCESGFYRVPAGGIVGIVFGKSPDAVHVVGQDDPGDDFEGALLAGGADGGAEGRDFAG